MASFASKTGPVRFASINIEGDKHLHAVSSFLKNFQPDIVCFQELTSSSVEFFEKALGMEGHFLPMTKDDIEFPETLFGIGLYSALPVSAVSARYYYGGSGNLPTLILEDEKTIWRALLQATVKKDSQFFTVATTHFTKTSDGSTSEKQRQDLKKLMSLLDAVPEFVLAGDFNAPRGREIFTALASRYKDNIPAEYTTSIDKNFHKAGGLLLMIDCLFSTPQYEVSDVRLTDGVSDHLAITALITKKV